MQAALGLFARQGYHATTVADVIGELGVARGTFYRYFNDKRDLFDQLLENNFRYVKRVLPLEALEGSIKAPDLEALLTASFMTLLAQPDSQEFMSMMVNDAAGADPFFAGKVNAFYDDLAEVFCSYISQVQTLGHFEDRDSMIYSYLILGVLKEIFVQWARGEKFDDLEELIHEVATFIVYGIGPRESK